MENLNKYNRGKIYAIRSHQTKNVYIGSSIDRLSNRLACHKKNLKMYINGRYHYTTSYEIVKFEDCYIELIEDYKCNNKMELNRREGQVIRETLNCVNKNIAGRTNAEYYNDNRETRIAQMKQYQQDNREALSIKAKQYHQDNREAISAKRGLKFNCECGRKYTYGHKARHLRSNKHQAYIATL